jgi:hypothetical protein
LELHALIVPLRAAARVQESRCATLSAAIRCARSVVDSCKWHPA